MSVLVAAGKRLNLLSWMGSPATPDGEDPLYPIANLYNGRPWERFRFASVGNLGINFDLSQVVNGGFEATFLVTGLPGTGWGKTAGATLARDTSVFQVGSASMRLTASGAGQGAYFDVYARPGSYWTISGRARSTAGGTLAAMRVRNLITGSYLTTLDTWSATPTNLANSATTDWGFFLGIVPIEDASLCGDVDVVPLRIQLIADSVVSNDIYFDEIFAHPNYNFAGLFGHNLPGRSLGTVQLCTGQSPGPITVRATLGASQRTMFASFALNAQRYARVQLATPALLDQVWFGELVLAATETLSRNPNWEHQVRVVDAQDRFDNGIGETGAYGRDGISRREMDVTFDNRLADHAQLARILNQSRNGLYPLVVVPDSDDTSSAMLCRVEPVFEHTRQFLTLRPAKLKFRELPFPYVTP